MLVYCGAQPERLDPDSGWTPLQSAVEEGHTTTVQALLEAGADPDASASSMSPPLAHAAREGRADILRLLVEFGADLNREDDGWTPLRLRSSANTRRSWPTCNRRGRNPPRNAPVFVIPGFRVIFLLFYGYE